MGSKALGLGTQRGRRTRRRPPEDPLARDLLAALRHGEGSLDALIGATGANAAAILATLAVLEIDGRVGSRGGDTYAMVEPI